MLGFDAITDQERPLGLLTNFLQNGTIPHALLFTGIEGVGKKTAAMALAMACNCSHEKSGQTGEGGQPWGEQGLSGKTAVRNPCGHCRPCRRILSGNHPDIIRVGPTGALIRIAQIRELCRTLTLKPYESGMRVVIISDSQAMNPEAGNALLKVLEEPPDRTILILTALQPSDLLPTIVSRCQQIRFNPLSRSTIAGILMERKAADSRSAGILAAMADGSFTKAMALGGTDWIRRRNWLIEAGGLDRCDPDAPRSMGKLLAVAETLASDKERLFDALEMIQIYYRDLLVWKYQPGKIVNQDLSDHIRCATEKIGVSSLIDKIEAVQAAQRDVQANVGVRLTLESLFLRLSDS